MVTKKLPLNDLDKTIIRKNIITAALFSILLTIVFFAVPASLIGSQNGKWTFGKIIICTMSFVFPIIPGCLFMLYRKNMKNKIKYVYTGIITDKQFKGDQQFISKYLVIDGKKIFLNSTIGHQYNDDVELWDWIEIHWLPQSKKMLYMKKGEPFNDGFKSNLFSLN